MKKYFKGKEYRNPELSYYLLTEEGVDAVDEAIKFLSEKAFVKEPLERSEELEKAATELV